MRDLKSVVAAVLTVSSAGSCAWAQFAPTSWTRANSGFAFARDFPFDGGATFSQDSFSQNNTMTGSWSTAPTATAAHGVLTSTSQIEQDSLISATELSASGTMKLAHNKPPSLSTAIAYGHVQYIVAFTVASATEVEIDFSYTSNVGTTGLVNAFQCVFGMSSSTGFSAYAGDTSFPFPDPTFSYQGLLQPGTYELSLDVLVDEVAEGNFRQPMSWEYGWDMSVKVVPAPAGAGLGFAMLGGLARRRR